VTFLSQIQKLLERTYSSTGINLEECLIGRQRCLELSMLAGPESKQLSLEGRTFLRVSEGRLYLAIYYDPSVITALEEHHPLTEISHENIRPLIVFLEELNHAVHAALLFTEERLKINSESFLCDLELQARIDTYLILELIVSVLQRRQSLTQRQRQWLQRCVFQLESFQYEDKKLRNRYSEANRLGLRLALYLDGLNPLERAEYIREFRYKPFHKKRSLIRKL
jgi:hypothetical protein